MYTRTLSITMMRDNTSNNSNDDQGPEAYVRNARRPGLEADQKSPSARIRYHIYIYIYN